MNSKYSNTGSLVQNHLAQDLLEKLGGLWELEHYLTQSCKEIDRNSYSISFAAPANTSMIRSPALSVLSSWSRSVAFEQSLAFCFLGRSICNHHPTLVPSGTPASGTASTGVIPSK